MVKRLLTAGLILAGLWDVQTARAVILTVNGNGTPPGRQTFALTPTAGAIPSNLQADYGEYFGTPVAANWFITAAHVLTPAYSSPPLEDKIVTGDGVSHYPTGVAMQIPGTDLILRQVIQPFNSANIAPIYNPATDGGPLLPGEALTVFGRGTQRGAERTAAQAGKGWAWGPIDAVRTYGTNTLDGFSVTTNNDVLDSNQQPTDTTFLVADFDQNGTALEGTLSEKDSAGGVFVFKNGAYRLVGINYGVELFRESPTGPDLQAAIYDARGLYQEQENGSYTLVDPDGPAVTQRFVSSYVPASLAFINTVVPEPGMAGVAGTMVLLAGRRRVQRPKV